uniref:EKC/KEOPS complex subunit TPRKB-like n=1 Tax=Styela clava TaxID=7725 RepID=UPI0019395CF8|nr:EKC/KEOPS complex subunit TPRKB-like [Styela clava]
MQTFNLKPLFPDQSVQISLFRNVTNAKELKELTTEGILQGCLIDGSLILDSFHILTAVNKALYYQKLGRMKTKSLYSEILFNLSPTNKINESLKTFGINEMTKKIIAVVLKDDLNSKVITESVNGEIVGLENLEKIIDVERIKKIYRLEQNEEVTVEAVVTRMATKDVK